MALDLINGLFEFVGSLMVWSNVRRLNKDKEVKGTNIFPVVFFSSWSMFNCIYYPSLNQWLSFLGGLSLGAANIAWLTLALRYRSQKYEVL